MNDAEIRLSVKIDDSTASKSINTLEQKTNSLSKSFTNAGKTLTAGLTLPIVALGTMAVKSASDLQETQNKVDVAFGDSADSVKEWGKTTIKQFGIAKGTALDMASLYGDMATGMGINQKEAGKLSTNMVGLAGDLASFKNISLDVAKTALAGIFTGETESLKQLGIIMTETNLKQYALSKGITTNIDDMTQAEKIQLRYAFVTEMSKNAVGDFSRTSESTANQTRTASETFKEISATLGEQLLPIVNKVLGKVMEFLNWINGLDEGQKKMLLTILGIIAVVGPILLILGQVIGFINVLTSATWLFNGALLASPITWIILGIVALIAIIVLLIANWDKVSAFMSNMWANWKNGFSIMWNFIKGIFKSITNGYISMVNILINGINSFIKLSLLPLNAIIAGINIPLKALGLKTISKISIAIPNIPKLATGTNNVAQEGLAYLHQGEAVVPKKYNPAIGGGRGSYATLNIAMGDINMDGNKVGRAVTPYVTKTVKLSGGNV